MKKLFFILLFSPPVLFSQIITYQKTFGSAGDDFGKCIQQTFDGGFIICGSSSAVSANFSDFYLVKLDANADTLLTKIYSLPDYQEANYVIQTPDSGYLIAGYEHGYGAQNNNICAKRHRNNKRIVKKS